MYWVVRTACSFVFVISSLLPARAAFEVAGELEGNPFTQTFGSAVAVGQSWILVGAPDEQVTANFEGVVYVFDAATQTRLWALTSGPYASYRDNFGCAVDVQGDLALIGAKNEDPGGIWSGAAYLYDAPSGTQLFRLVANDAETGDNLGFSVALESPYALAGSYFKPAGNNTQVGAVYVFDVATGQQVRKIGGGLAGLADDVHFGWSVDLHDGVALIGAPGDDLHGSAFLIPLDNPVASTRLTAGPGDTNVNDRFGAAVAMDQTFVVVGDTHDDTVNTQAGAAYVFLRSTGALLHKLVPSPPEYNARFGNAVAVGGGRVLVGSANQSTVYVFDAATGDPAQTIPTPQAWSAGFGESVATRGASIVAGAPFGNGGRAWLFGPAPTAAPTPRTAVAWLLPNHPNPFNPQTTIRYHVGQPGLVHLNLYDAAGRHVRTLVAGVRIGEGVHELRWDGTDGDGRTLPSGVYHVRLAGSGNEDTRPVVLVR